MSRTRLRRLRRTFDDDQPQYEHPNGYIIRRWKRSWSERVGAMRGASLASPMFAWEVHKVRTRPRTVVWSAGTLREASAWCDDHPRA